MVTADDLFLCFSQEILKRKSRKIKDNQKLDKENIEKKARKDIQEVKFKLDPETKELLLSVDPTVKLEELNFSVSIYDKSM